MTQKEALIIALTLAICANINSWIVSAKIETLQSRVTTLEARK